MNQEILLEPARKLGNDINTFVIKKNIFYALVKELNCSFVTKLLYARFICYSNYISLPPRPPLYLHCYLLPLFFYSSPILIYSTLILPPIPLFFPYSPPYSPLFSPYSPLARLMDVNIGLRTGILPTD